MANHQRLFALPLVRIAFDDTRTSVSANIKSKIKKWQQNTETSMGKVNQEIERPVSYTHLTLPTIYSV